MTSPEQHAATVERLANRLRDGFYAGVTVSPHEWEAALDEVVALAGRADELQHRLESSTGNALQGVPVDSSGKSAPSARSGDALEAGGGAVTPGAPPAAAAEARADELEREVAKARRQVDQREGWFAQANEAKAAAEARADEMRREVERLTLPNIARDQLPMLYEQARREVDQLRAALEKIAERCESEDYAEEEQAIFASQRARAALAGVQADSKHSAGLAAGDTGMGYGGSPDASAASVAASESVTRGVPAPAANLAETALRLMAVDYAPFLNIANPETTVEEYLRRAEKGERWPFGLWQADSKGSA